jgi:teichoic acid transport system permease protein
MTSATGTQGLGEYSDVEYVFEAHSIARPSVREYVSGLWERREFALTLAKSDLRGSNNNTILGELWALVDPLIQAGIYFFIVAIIRGPQGNVSAISYFMMIIAGVFLFSYTRASLNDGGRSIIKSKNLILNSSFPRALLPLAEVYKGFLEFLPSVGLYAILCIVTQQTIGPGIFLLPLLFLLQTAMNIGLALLVATATVFIRDTVNALNYVMRVLIFITPVIYPVSLLSPVLRTILSINPLFALFASYQTIVLGGVPSAGQVFLAAAWAIVLLVAGYRVFVSHERAFALRL